MSDTTQEPELMTAAEVGARLGCKGTSVLRWMKEGIIPAAVRRGKFIRFDIAAVREALRQDAAKQSPPAP